MELGGSSWPIGQESEIVVELNDNARPIPQEYKIEYKIVVELDEGSWPIPQAYEIVMKLVIVLDRLFRSLR